MAFSINNHAGEGGKEVQSFENTKENAEEQGEKEKWSRDVGKL